MNKTSEDIEAYVYSLVRTALQSEISGSVYRMGMRPDNSHLEDIVVGFIEGVNGQFQSSAVYVSIYVPDIAFQNRKVKNFQRCDYLSAKLNSFAHNLPINPYRFQIGNTINVVRFEDIEQHCVALKLLVRNNTF